MIFIFIILLVLGEIGASILIKRGKRQRHLVMGEADNIVMTSSNKE